MGKTPGKTEPHTELEPEFAAERDKTVDNMALWDKVCTTDPTFTKDVSMRGGFTSINPTYQCRLATQQWGPQGAAWGIRDIRWEFHGNSIIMAGTFWYPGGEFVQVVDDQWKDGDDTMKKCLTELQSKALSRLGFNADIFSGRWDDNKYVMQDQRNSDHHAPRPRQQQPQAPRPAAPKPATAAPPPTTDDDDGGGQRDISLAQFGFFCKCGEKNGWKLGDKLHILTHQFGCSAPEGRLAGEAFKSHWAGQIDRALFTYLCGNERANPPVTGFFESIKPDEYRAHFEPNSQETTLLDTHRTVLQQLGAMGVELVDGPPPDAGDDGDVPF